MNHKKIDALAETMRIIYEQTENNMVTEINVALAKQTPTRPLARKLNAIKMQSDSMVETMLKKISDDEGIQLARLTSDNRVLTSQLVDGALNMFNRSANRIQLRGATPLVESVKLEANRNFTNRMKVTYRDGRNVGYKEYMEMATRTTIQQEIGNAQLVTGGNAGVVFYITNHFRDCADDHKDYQGKIYYDARWREFGYDAETTERIQGVINKKRMLSVQEVRDGKPWLTTRPNCRHTFTPISLEQATGKASDVVSDLKLSTGSYRDANYEDTVKQRYNERQIRFYKARMEQYDKMGADYSDFMQRDKTLVAKWQARQRALMDKNSTLSRDYRRESLKIGT